MMKIDKFIGDLVQEMIADDDECYTAHDINHGLCSIFAHNLAAELKYYHDIDGIIQHNNDHYWVVVDGKYYDAETPEGAASPEELGFYLSTSKGVME